MAIGCQKGLLYLCIYLFIHQDEIQQFSLSGLKISNMLASVEMCQSREAKAEIEEEEEEEERLIPLRLNL